MLVCAGSLQPGIALYKIAKLDKAEAVVKKALELNRKWPGPPDACKRLFEVAQIRQG